MKPPHQLSSEAIEEFKDIYSREFGRTLADEDANQMATDVLRLFDLFLKPESDQRKGE